MNGFWTAEKGFKSHGLGMLKAVWAGCKWSEEEVRATETEGEIHGWLFPGWLWALRGSDQADGWGTQRCWLHTDPTLAHRVMVSQVCAWLHGGGKREFCIPAMEQEGAVWCRAFLEPVFPRREIGKDSKFLPVLRTQACYRACPCKESAMGSMGQWQRSHE